MNFNDILVSLLLIAAIALVVALVILVNRLTTVLKTTDDLLKDTKNTLDVVTKDVDSLSIEVEGLLNKTNHLLNDINGKLEKTDPVFSAIGELGVSVSHVNESANRFTKSFILKKNKVQSDFVKTGKNLTAVLKGMSKKNHTVKKF